jgi:hypothetical protein
MDGLDIDDFLFWDVNDDSLFVDDELLSSFVDGPIDFSNNDSTASNSSAANSSAAPVQQGAPKKQKPMLSKYDKRRTYAKMFAEAFNSGDANMLKQFLDTSCTEECVMLQKCVVTGNPFIPKYVEVFGAAAILQFWANTFLTIPDCLMVMLETKLRIRHRNFSKQQQAADAADAVHQPEGSSYIVSSFSFTGTKLYTTKMEGAIIQPMSNHSGSNQEQQLVTTNVEITAAVPVTATTIIKPGGKNSSKKRSITAMNSDSSGGTGAAAGGGSSGLPNEGQIDKFNIFLHPPRKYSTLAGTPFGGAPQYFTKHHVNQPSAAVAKMSDYISINANTRIEQGSFMENEGYINFLGTLTMTVDSDNKICKFEFLYSHMD